MAKNKKEKRKKEKSAVSSQCKAQSREGRIHERAQLRLALKTNAIFYHILLYYCVD